MRQRRASILVRGSALVVVAGMAPIAAVWLATPALRALHASLTGDAATAGIAFDVALLGVFATALVTAALWVPAVTVVLVAEAVYLAGDRPADGAWSRALVRCSPWVVRRLVVTCCGLVLTVPAAGAASAEPAGEREPARMGATDGISGLAVPDRVAGGLSTASRTDCEISVSTGDSLWSIAERIVSGDAPDTRVDRTWRAVYAANRHRIGPDPHLIFPGTVLAVPCKSER